MNLGDLTAKLEQRAVEADDGASWGHVAVGAGRARGGERERERRRGRPGAYES